MRRLPALFRLTLVFVLLLPAVASFTRALADETAGAAPPPKEKAILSSAPEFSGPAVVGGKSCKLSDLLKHGPVLLDFWATWCVPCLEELPHLQKIWLKYQDRGFNLVGVACDDPKTAAKIKPLIQSKGLKFINIADVDHKIRNMYNIRNFPTSILIGTDGRIVSISQGYRPGDEAHIDKAIAGLLEGAESGAAGDSSSAQPASGAPGGSR